MSNAVASQTVAVTVEDVRRVFRQTLGREPETEDALRLSLVVPDLHALYRHVLVSDEFRVKQGQTRRPVPLLTAMRPIQDTLPERPLARLLEAVAIYWEGVGEEDPHWSVLTDERFRSANIEKNSEDFFRTGDHDLRMIRHALTQFWTRPDAPERLVEFGCGVGRVSVHLCENFPEVVGCDISGSHLRLAVASCEARGFRNFTPFRVTPRNIVPEVATDL